MSALDLFASALGGFVLVAIILFPYFQQGRTFQDQASSAEAAASAASASASSARAAQSSAEATASAAVASADAASEAQASAQSAASEAQAQLSSAQDTASSAQAAAASAQSSASEAGDAMSSAFVRQAALTSALSSAEDKTSSLMLEAAKTFLIVMIEWQEDVDVDLAVTDPQGRTFGLGTQNREGTNFPGVKSQLSVDNTYGPGIEIWQAPDGEPGTYKIVYTLFGYNTAPAGSAVPVKGTVFYRNGTLELPLHSLQGDKNTFAVNVEVTDNGLTRLAP